MAFYNDAVWLPRVLDALEHQTFRDFVLVAHDDGSTDDSAAIVEGRAGRLPLQLERAPHCGRHDAKRAVAARAVESGAQYLLVLDSDIELAQDAIARMVTLLDGDPSAAVVFAQARASASRPFGRAQAFVEDLFFLSNSTPDGQGRWIVGGCALFRWEALRQVSFSAALLEDNEMSQQLRRRWKLLQPRDLRAVHYGVPTTLGGLLRRGHRDGVRVAALLRAHPDARQLGNLARLVPLPLVAAGVVGALTAQTWLTMASGVGLAGYAAGFLWMSRHVSATPAERLAGLGVFTLGNLGFAIGYLDEVVRGRRRGHLEEPKRAT
jgi:hypothetical protein